MTFQPSHPHETMKDTGAPVGPEPGEDADFDALQALAADPATEAEAVALINAHNGDLHAAAAALAAEG